VHNPRRMHWLPTHMTDERKLNAVEELIPLAEEVSLAPTHLAMAFAITHPGVTSAVIGPRTTGHLDDLLAGAAVTLDDEVLDRIDHTVPPRNRHRPARCVLRATCHRTRGDTPSIGRRARGDMIR
jgi:aryl-alcohol dehydrogenase-like predicted oxidoreductase